MIILALDNEAVFYFAGNICEKYSSVIMEDEITNTY